MKSNNPVTIIPFEAIRERDTDMLLLEELLCNPIFSKWFLNKTIGIRKNYMVDGAWHSITHSGLGESDLAFKIKTGKEKILFLIENKIHAEFMPEQANRYRKRGDHKQNAGECTSFFTVLFAPESYIQENRDFDFNLSYEDVRNWFLSEKQMGERGKFKAEILNIAIERMRRGYTAIINKDTTKFRWDYYRYAEENYPHLGMLKPKDEMPRKVGFIKFKPKGINLKTRESIIHKKRGDVDLNLDCPGMSIEEFNLKYRRTLSDKMHFVKTNGFFIVRISTPAVNIEKDFQKQLPEIKSALNKVRTLFKWAKKNLNQR